MAQLKRPTWAKDSLATRWLKAFLKKKEDFSYDEPVPYLKKLARQTEAELKKKYPDTNLSAH